MSAILHVFRGYRSSFENDELVSSLRRLRESEQGQENRPSSIEEVDFSNLLRDIEVLINAKKKKEALMALVAARLRMNDLDISQRSRERFEGDFARLRAEIDAI